MKPTQLEMEEFTPTSEFPPQPDEFPVTRESSPLPSEFSAESEEASPGNQGSSMKKIQKMLAILCAAGITIGGSYSFFSGFPKTDPIAEPSIIVEDVSVPVETPEISEVSEPAEISSSITSVEESILETPAIDLSFSRETLISLRDDLLTDNYLSFYRYTFDPPEELLALDHDLTDVDTIILTDSSVYPLDSTEYDPSSVQMTLQVAGSFDPALSQETPLSLRVMLSGNSDTEDTVFLFAGGGEIIVLEGIFDDTLSSEEAHFLHYVGSPNMWLLTEDAVGKVHHGVFYGPVISTYYNDFVQGTETDNSGPTPFGTILYDLNEDGRLDPSQIDLIPADMDVNTAVQNGYRYSLENGSMKVYIEPVDETDAEFASFRFTPMEGDVSKVIFDTTSLSALFDLYQ